MSGWRWVELDVVFALHDRQIAEHGGPDGLRDRGALESAMARPRNLAAYGTPDPADLAAAYAWGLARNHPFADGNKRVAWIVARLFLARNGLRLAYDPGEAVGMMLSVAAGGASEADLVLWLRKRLRPSSANAGPDNPP